MKRIIRNRRTTAALLAAFAGVSPAFAVPPANDDCPNAFAVGEGVYNGTMQDATSDGPAACGQPDTADVWYLYLASATGVVALDTCVGASFDTTISVWSGCGGVMLACNDDACGTGSSVSLAASAGESYLVRIACASPILNPGDFVFRIASGDASGACCIVEVCSEMTSAACNAAGGTYAGDGTTCGSVSCEPAFDGWAFGLPHAALGNAELHRVGDALQAAGCCLGSTGNDGVRITHEDADSFIVYRLLEAIPAGGVVEITSRGEVDGTPDQPIATFGVTRGEGESFLEVLWDNSSNATYQYQVYNDGQLVGALPGGDLRVTGELSGFASGNPGDVDPMLPNIGCCGWYSGTYAMRPCKWCHPSGGLPIYSNTQPAGYIWCGCAPDIYFPWWRFMSAEQAVLTVQLVDGGPILNGDSIVIVATDAPPVGALSATEITASGVASFTIAGEAVGAHGRSIRATGEARLQTTDASGDGIPDVVISGIGGTGQDGVEWITTPTPREELSLLDFDMTSSNAVIDVEALGEVDGVPDQVISAIHLARQGASIAFAPLDEPGQTYTVRVLHDDQVVTEVDTDTGEGFTFTGPGWLAVGKCCPRDRNGRRSELRYAAPTQITIVGGPTVIGDEVQIDTHDAPGLSRSFGDITAVSVRGANVDSLAITGIWRPMPPSVDTFDQYPDGTDINGVGMYSGWGDDVTLPAIVSDDQAHSGANSLSISDNADIVAIILQHEWVADIAPGATETGERLVPISQPAHESGDARSASRSFNPERVWSTWMYVPTNFQSACDGLGNCGSYVILMNRYEANGPKNWSVQLHADSNTNLFIRDGLTPDALPLVRGRWVELVVQINFDEDAFRVFYDGQELGQEASWMNDLPGDPGGALPQRELAAADFFANGSSVVYYDDVRLEDYAPPAVLGDLNCDGTADILDINPFILALGNPAGYQAQFPDCDILLGDINGDGELNVLDINPFVALLSGM
ncbi:hypothetical protein RAS1_31120 [Phycisphaerae bacterium RAS1]|nr:hypothetical protein RAS1_31120 [Phycisphaerae bacterium RAS1]